MRKLRKLVERFQRLLRIAPGKNGAIWACLLVTLFGSYISYLVAIGQNERIEEQTQNELTRRMDSILEEISNRLSSYNEILVSGTTVFRINNQLTRSQWREFISGLRVRERFPGTLGIGYAVAFEHEDRVEHVQQLREQGFSNYNLEPSYKRNEYTAIIYREPFDATLEGLLGYDMFTDSTRNMAMSKARDSGGITITEPVNLKVVDGEEDSPVGLLIYSAVYNSEDLPNSVDSRRDSLQGYVYASLNIEKIAISLFEDSINDDRFEFKLSDPNANDKGILFETEHFKDTTGESGRYVESEFGVFDRSWRIEVVANDKIAFKGINPLTLLSVGVVLSVFIGAFLFVLILSRMERVEFRHEREVQKTKDEMLALASHQLRTPATGVKQYIGMISQGFAGEISDEQKELLDKAYKSNERQLDIINQLLYVAKADAGQIFLDPEKISVNDLVESVVDNYREQAEGNGLKIIVSKLKKNVRVEVDERYIRMALENLVSNAIKYSNKGKDIKVNLNVEDSKFVKVSVIDRGVGIADEDMHLLFKKFSRIDNPLSRTVGGSGLGLFLAKKLVDAHGGRVEFESELGEGTTVGVLLPKVISDDMKRNISNRKGWSMSVRLRR